MTHFLPPERVAVHKDFPFYSLGPSKLYFWCVNLFPWETFLNSENGFLKKISHSIIRSDNTFGSFNFQVLLRKIPNSEKISEKQVLESWKQESEVYGCTRSAYHALRDRLGDKRANDQQDLGRIGSLELLWGYFKGVSAGFGLNQNPFEVLADYFDNVKTARKHMFSGQLTAYKLIAKNRTKCQNYLKVRCLAVNTIAVPWHLCIWR